MFLLEAVYDTVHAGYEKFVSVVNIVLPVVIGVVLVLGMFYGITLGIKFAKAEEDEDKKKAKSSLINVVVGCLIVILFIAIVQIILNQHFIEELFPATPSDLAKTSASA